MSAQRVESMPSVVRRGVPNATLQALGRGEDVPIADNGTEAGRSLNRRVEIRCR